MVSKNYDTDQCIFILFINNYYGHRYHVSENGPGNNFRGQVLEVYRVPKQAALLVPRTRQIYLPGKYMLLWKVLKYELGIWGATGH